MTKKNIVPPTKKRCLKCEKEKNITDNFYLSNSPNHADQRFPVCKPCLKSGLNFTEPMSQNCIDSVKNVLLEMNRPFVFSIYVTSVEEAERKGREIFGIYLKNILLNDKHLTWKDSSFELNRTFDAEETEIEPQKSHNSNFIITDEIISKWGYGYNNEEYKAFENKYLMLRNNYQEKTAMHTEALLTYIRYRVKEEMATAKNDMKAAKDWGQLAQKAATDAKINPSQLSKSDLSDGLDTFGQLVRTVEQAIDIIPILPKFKERPQDKVDFTLWCYINYVRDLKGLPLVEYKDIYGFYEARKKEFEDRFEDLESEV